MPTLANLQLDSSAALPRYRQLYDALRASILAARLRAGTRLPSTRALASELGISRNTMPNAYAQLLAEEYVEGAVGSGTYVAHTLPDDVLHAHASASPVPQSMQAQRMLSRRGTRFAGMSPPGGSVRGEVRAFCVSAFPNELWRRLGDNQSVPRLFHCEPMGRVSTHAATGRMPNYRAGQRRLTASCRMMRRADEFLIRTASTVF